MKKRTSIISKSHLKNSLDALSVDYVDGYLLHDIPIVKENPSAINASVDYIQSLKEPRFD